MKINSVDFMNKINTLPDRDYLLSMIYFSAAPTIKGNKPSTLVTFTKNKRNLYDLWNTHKKFICNRLDMEYVQLRKRHNSVRVLFYKRELMEKCLFKKECRDFLNSMGYDSETTLEECIAKLKNRFEYICPHEIGIFLGIPVEDVIGFIINNGENSIICKYWKVYHNPENARLLFDSYDKARECVKSLLISL